MERNSRHGHKPEKTSALPDNLKGNPFKVPDGYFEGFHDRLRERLEKPYQAKVAPVYRISRRTLILVAASVILLLTIGSIMLVKYQSKPVSLEVSYFTISLDDLEEAYSMDRFDEFTLVSFYLENSDEFTYPEETDIKELLPIDSSITNKDIEQYLIESNELENLILNL